jgi:tRNA A37 threonylcarbamoyladenosine dehydratase
MRRELKKRNIEKVLVLYSKEEPKNVTIEENSSRHAPSSISFVPSVAGLLISSKVIKDLLDL